MTEMVRIPINEIIDGHYCYVVLKMCACGGEPKPYRNKNLDQKRFSMGLMGAVGFQCSSCGASTRECLAESPTCAANEAAVEWNDMQPGVIPEGECDGK